MARYLPSHSILERQIEVHNGMSQVPPRLDPPCIDFFASASVSFELDPPSNPYKRVYPIWNIYWLVYPIWST